MSRLHQEVYGWVPRDLGVPVQGDPLTMTRMLEASQPRTYHEATPKRIVRAASLIVVNGSRHNNLREGGCNRFAATVSRLSSANATNFAAYAGVHRINFRTSRKKTLSSVVIRSLSSMDHELRSQQPQQEQANESDDAPQHIQSSSSHSFDSNYPPAVDIEALDSGHSATSRPFPREYRAERTEQFLTRPPRSPEAQITGSRDPGVDTQTGNYPEAYHATENSMLPSTPTDQEQPSPGMAHARSSEAVNDESFEEPPS